MVLFRKLSGESVDPTQPCLHHVTVSVEVFYFVKLSVALLDVGLV